MIKDVILRRPPQGSLRFSHPWVYRNQIKDVSADASPGDIVSVHTESGKFMGRGYWNPRSEITVRLLTRMDEPVDAVFFSRRFRRALAYRRSVLSPDTNGFRLISSEADGIPGLIVDRYADVLVIQFLTLGIESLRDVIVEALRETMDCRGIYERSDASSRKLEGLADRTGWIEKNCGDKVVIREQDLEIEMVFGEGHKTGWYLDQRENRMDLRRFAKAGGDALDVFCYEGGFGLHLAKAGMKVLGIDSQKDVLGRAEIHRKNNRISEASLSFRAENAFDALKALEKQGKYFDMIVLDPPSFVKQKSALAGAVSGYREIAHRAFRMLHDGGSLAIFSCAYHLDDHWLMQACLAAAKDAKKDVILQSFFKQAADHPIRPWIPETYYLKGFLFRVAGD